MSTTQQRQKKFHATHGKTRIRASNQRRVVNGLLVIALVVAGIGSFLFWQSRVRRVEAVQSAKPERVAPAHPLTLAQLLACKPTQLEETDIGLINLLCAQGLRGSESLNVAKCLERLDGMANYVKQETERHLYKFRDHPEQFRHSLPYFQMMMLGTVLAQDLGIHYNPRIALPQLDGQIPTLGIAADSHDMFIHGLLTESGYGTCASMPVLYVAVARRLGYPVHLAAAKYHLYVRYELPDNKHLNVEATMTDGFLTPPDEDYKFGKLPFTDEEEKGYGWLRPLSNRESLGHFLGTRAIYLGNMKRYAEAKETLLRSLECSPDTSLVRAAAQSFFDELRDAPLGDKIDDIAQMSVPSGPRFVYFENRKLQVRYFAGLSPDRAACEKAIDDLNRELTEYRQQMAQMGSAPAAQQGQHILQLKTKSGKEVRIPAESLPPPLNRGTIPPGYLERIIESSLEDQGIVLDEIWKQYQSTTVDWMEQTKLLTPTATLPLTAQRQ